VEKISDGNVTVIGFWSLVLCRGRPLDVGKPHILAKAAEIGFLY
jgi:hypothetical protein